MNYIGHNQWNGLKFDKFWEKVTSKHYDKIIVFGQNEWQYYAFAQYEELANLCKARNQPLYIITGSHKVFDHIDIDNVEVIFWDTYWLGKTWEAMSKQSIQRITFDESYSNYFISLNNRAHNHRAVLLDLLAKHDLLRLGAVSFIQQPFNFTWEYFKGEIPLLLSDNFLENREQYKPPKEYYESFMQIVSESPDKGIILSEKTAIPLILGKPFLIANAPGYHKFLKEKGFQLYDEIFDYSFDDVQDEKIRFELLIQNVKELTKIPLSDLNLVINKIKDKLIFNKNLAKKIIYDENLYPTIAKDVIKHYHNTGEMIDEHLLHVHLQLQSCKNIQY